MFSFTIGKSIRALIDVIPCNMIYLIITFKDFFPCLYTITFFSFFVSRMAQVYDSLPLLSSSTLHCNNLCMWIICLRMWKYIWYKTCLVNKRNKSIRPSDHWQVTNWRIVYIYTASRSNLTVIYQLWSNRKTRVCILDRTGEWRKKARLCWVSFCK